MREKSLICIIKYIDTTCQVLLVDYCRNFLKSVLFFILPSTICVFTTIIFFPTFIPGLGLESAIISFPSASLKYFCARWIFTRSFFANKTLFAFPQTFRPFSKSRLAEESTRQTSNNASVSPSASKYRIWAFSWVLTKLPRSSCRAIRSKTRFLDCLEKWYLSANLANSWPDNSTCPRKLHRQPFALASG